MNARRGLFRFWILATVLFVAAVSFTSYSEIRNSFEIERLIAFLDANGDVTMVPTDCAEARGQETHDFERQADGFCWYGLPKFRAVYPEYGNMPNQKLIDSLYRKRGLPVNERRSLWILLAEKVGIAIGIPLAVLVAGWALLWALAGFSTKP
ncbi:MAG: hypothetical protein J0H82_30485 [Alphaproteobacteria bacterium]|jgi:hypothetical protein|nr:hypothetical protein [Alphaproteobacteria bacterium]